MPGATPLISLDDALAAALADLRPITARDIVALDHAYDRVLATDLVARCDTPPADNSAMDGYALARADLPAHGAAVMSLAGASLAGHPFTDPLPPGTAVRIATGGVIPPRADAVIMQEDVARADTETVEIDAGQVARIAIGDHIRRRGEDVAAGSVILAAGHRLRPQDVAVAAGQGYDRLEVVRRPRVAVFSTGDELVGPGASLGPGQIYESNRYAMIGSLRDWGCAVSDLGLLPDRADRLTDALAAAARDHEVILTSGGVSVGAADLLKPVVERLGDIRAWKLAIKPGKPLMRGRIGDCLILGLPGNPVSTMITQLLFAKPLLLKMMGVGDIAPLRLPMRAGFAWRRRAGRQEWLRARLAVDAHGETVVQVYHSASSGMLSSMVWADGLVELDRHCAEVEPGDTVVYLPLRGNMR